MTSYLEHLETGSPLCAHTQKFCALSESLRFVLLVAKSADHSSRTALDLQKLHRWRVVLGPHVLLRGQLPWQVEMLWNAPNLDRRLRCCFGCSCSHLCGLEVLARVTAHLVHERNNSRNHTVSTMHAARVPPTFRTATPAHAAARVQEYTCPSTCTNMDDEGLSFTGSGASGTLQVQPSPQVQSLHIHLTFGHAKPSRDMTAIGATLLSSRAPVSTLPAYSNLRAHARARAHASNACWSAPARSIRHDQDHDMYSIDSTIRHDALPYKLAGVLQ
jgi:hypothetical protein